MPAHSPTFETLESRQMLSIASDIGLIDSIGILPDRFQPAYSQSILHAAPVTPNIKRTFSGTFSVKGVSGTFRLVVRKEDYRVGYAALRGTLDVVTASNGSIHADMTYGKIRDNDRVNMTLVQTTPPFNVTITGKASTSGSQIKGQIDVTGTINVSTTFIISKVVRT